MNIFFIQVNNILDEKILHFIAVDGTTLKSIDIDHTKLKYQTYCGYFVCLFVCLFVFKIKMMCLEVSTTQI
jgi:hypothetical protein